MKSLLFAFAYTLHAALLTSTVAVSTSPGSSPIPDCSLQSSGAYIQCLSPDGSTVASGQSQAFFDSLNDQGSVSLDVSVGRVAGTEQGKASAISLLDVFFVPGFTGQILGIYSYSLSLDVPPNLQITQDGSVYHWTHFDPSSGEITLTSNVMAGVPFEVRLSLDGVVRTPSGLSVGQAQLFEFTDSMGQRLVLAEGSSVPTGGTGGNPMPEPSYGSGVALILLAWVSTKALKYNRKEETQ